MNGIITELRSEALKERHWRALKKRLNVNWVFSELTLGHLWDSDIQKNEAIYKEIITQAQGELALEEFLKQVYILFGSINGLLTSECECFIEFF